jgi:hypothetical protein
MGKEDVQSFIREISDFSREEGAENKKSFFQDSIKLSKNDIRCKNNKNDRNNSTHRDHNDTYSWVCIFTYSWAYTYTILYPKNYTMLCYYCYDTPLS